MKKQMFYLACLLYLFISVAQAEVIPQEVIPQTATATAPTLESEWSEAGHIRMARFYGSDQFADFWLHWDASNLYIKGEIQDYTPASAEGITPGQTHDGKRWNTQFDDNIQISIATNSSKYKAIAFSPSGQLWKIDDCTPPLSTCLGSTATYPNPTVGKLDNPSASIPSSYIKTSKIVGGKWRFMLSLPASLFDLPTFSLNNGLAINFYHDSIGNFVPTGDKLDFKSDGMSKYTKLKKQGDTWVEDKDTYVHDGMPANEWSVYQGDRNKPTEWAIFTLSAADVPKPVITKTPTPGFVTVSSTGRSFELNGKPFVVVSETALMPWLPLRGLYNGVLCDERYPDADPEIKDDKVDGCKLGTGIDVRSRKQFRNYYTNEIYKFPNVSGTLSELPLKREKDNTLSEFSIESLKTEMSKVIDKPTEPAARKLNGMSQGNYNAWVQLIENNQVEDCPTINTKEDEKKITKLCQAEGRGVAIRYFKELKKYGINTLSIFVESLDLTETPIIFGKDRDNEIFDFLDRVIKLASDNNVRLILRLYDTYYYGDKEAKDSNEELKSAKIGRISENGFFNEANYLPSSQDKNTADKVTYQEIHQERMVKLFNHKNTLTGNLYSQDPAILGWDIVNEIDNKDRFNTASYADRKAWVEAIAPFVKAQVKQLVFFSFLTWDPKDGDSYRRYIGDPIDPAKPEGEKLKKEDYLGLDATLAYRMPNIDFASPHTYYAHIANPGQLPLPPDGRRDEFHPAIELARGIAYGFYQIRDGRPILDTEGGPQEFFVGNKYSEVTTDKNGKTVAAYLPDRLFNKGNDTEIFINSIWTHFAAGGAGANTRWPHDLESSSGRTNQISPEWREALWAFHNEVGDIPWDGNQLKVDHVRQNSAGQSPIIPEYKDGKPINLAGTTFTVARYDDKHAVVYAYNHDKQKLDYVALPEQLAKKLKAKGKPPFIRAVEFGYSEQELKLKLVYREIGMQKGQTTQEVEFASVPPSPLSSFNRVKLGAPVSNSVALIISFDEALLVRSMSSPANKIPKPSVTLSPPVAGVGVGMKGGLAIDAQGKPIPTDAKFAIGVSSKEITQGQPIAVQGNIQSDSKHTGTAELIVVALYKKAGTDCTAPVAGSEANEGYYVLSKSGYCRYLGENGKVNTEKQNSECYSPANRSKPVESWGTDWQQWDGKLESLEAFKEVTLPITSATIEPLSLYDDPKVSYAGHVCLTFGYRLKGQNGSVFFNGDPVQFTVK